MNEKQEKPRDWKGILEYIAASPKPEHGGFDEQTVFAVKAALAALSEKEEENEDLKGVADGYAGDLAAIVKHMNTLDYPHHPEYPDDSEIIRRLGEMAGEAGALRTENEELTKQRAEAQAREMERMRGALGYLVENTGGQGCWCKDLIKSNRPCARCRAIEFLPPPEKGECEEPGCNDGTVYVQAPMKPLGVVGSQHPCPRCAPTPDLAAAVTEGEVKHRERCIECRGAEIVPCDDSEDPEGMICKPCDGSGETAASISEGEGWPGCQVCAGGGWVKPCPSCSEEGE